MICAAMNSIPSSAMKTDHDLFREWIDYLLSQAGADHQEIQRKLREMERLFRLQPPKPLTETDYENKLLQMKQETPAYLRHLGLE